MAQGETAQGRVRAQGRPMVPAELVPEGPVREPLVRELRVREPLVRAPAPVRGLGRAPPAMGPGLRAPGRARAAPNSRRSR